MKTITELWNELRNHPDFVTGTCWTVQDIIENAECYVEDNDSVPLDEVGNHAEFIIRYNKEKIANIISEWEGSCYENCSWSGEEDFSDLLDLI
jgi:hypothetical protein